MDLTDLLPRLIDMGVSGLFFVMWFYERKDRLVAVAALSDMRPRMKTIEELFSKVLGVVESNTRAMNNLVCHAPTIAEKMGCINGSERHSG